MHTRRLDLNLLVVLEAILAERNVTRAAKRLHISQPALSHALARLRVALGDPLLVREAGVMVPTPKALRMEAPLSRVLQELEDLLAAQADFNPATLDETLYLGATDYAEFVLIPAVAARLRAQAPALKFITRDISADLLGKHLSTGKIDMAIAYSPSPTPAAGVHEEVLFEDRYVVIAARDLIEELTLDNYLSHKHLQVSLRGQLGGIPDQVLATLGKAREVVFSTPHFLAAAGIVAKSDLLMTTPRRVGQRLARELPLRVFEPPYRLPKIELRLVWHARTQLDSTQQWVRRVLRESARELPASDEVGLAAPAARPSARSKAKAPSAGSSARPGRARA